MFRLNFYGGVTFRFGVGFIGHKLIDISKHNFRDKAEVHNPDEISAEL